MASYPSHDFHTTVNVKLNEENYKICSNFMCLIRRGLGLLCHIDDTSPLKTDLTSSSTSLKSLSSQQPSTHRSWGKTMTRL